MWFIKSITALTTTPNRRKTDMTYEVNCKESEACTLAQKTAGRYGRLALTRAAGQAAEAQRAGDHETSALWQSVVSCLREAILQADEVAA